MPDYHIIPKAPLLFRDGRPFDSGGVAETLPFPLPSTIAGAFRTAYGDEKSLSFTADVKKLLDISVSGPLLTLTKTGENEKDEIQILFPAPADALCLNSENGATIHRLRPKTPREGEGSDLPGSALLPVFLTTDSLEKPFSGAPLYWQPEIMLKWLLDNTDEFDAADIGAGSLPLELRTHVKMQNTTLTAEPGRLFQTVGLDMGEQKQNKRSLYGWQPGRYGFAIQSPETLSSTYRTVGGESRLARIEPVDNLWPTYPPKLQQALKKAEAIRVMLVTPAIFDNGWLPNWLDEKSLEGILPDTTLKLKLRAVANPRWQAVSGWAMQPGYNGRKRGAKPARRAVPAGAVYWFDILAGDKEDLSKLWLKPISDQQAKDGFGLMIPGIWSGETEHPAQTVNEEQK